MLADFGKPPALPTQIPSSAKEVIPWYFKTGMLIVAFLVVGPLMLPLIFFNPHLSRRNKLVWTIVISVVSLVLGWAFAKALARLMEYYRMLWL